MNEEQRQLAIMISARISKRIDDALLTRDSFGTLATALILKEVIESMLHQFHLKLSEFEDGSYYCFNTDEYQTLVTEFMGSWYSLMK